MKEQPPKKRGIISFIREYLNEVGRCSCDREIFGAPARPYEKAPEQPDKDKANAADR